MHEEDKFSLEPIFLSYMKKKKVRSPTCKKPRRMVSISIHDVLIEVFMFQREEPQLWSLAQEQTNQTCPTLPLIHP
jgi:hypothetical protein